MAATDDILVTRDLNKLIKMLMSKKSVIRIGVTGTRNATIGLAHEFGTATLPQRSFLRMPLIDVLPKRLSDAGLNDREVLRDVITKGSQNPWLKRIAAVAHATILEAFSTGGWGEWPPYKDPNYENNTGMLLVDTGQLMESVTVEVKGE
jgi:hypothetical protein